MDRTNYSKRTNKQNSEGKCLPHHRQSMPLAAISVQSEHGQINSGYFVHPDSPLSHFRYSSKYARGRMNRTNQSSINKSVKEQTSTSDKNQYPSSSDRKACNKGQGHLRTTKDTMDERTNKQTNEQTDVISVQTGYGQINNGSFVHPDPPISHFRYSSKYARGE